MICERCRKEFETLNKGHCPKCWEELLVFMRRNIELLDEDIDARERDGDAPDPEEE